MKQYEVTIITKTDEKETPVKKEIEALGGKVISVNSLGQKQLIYPIKKEKEAYYASIVFEMEGEKLGELNRKMGLKDEILRHLIIIAPRVKPTALKEIKEPKKAAPEKEEEKQPLEEVIIEKPKEKKAVAPVKTIAPKKKEVAEPELDEEERLKALDKKLDELLKE